MEDPIQNLTSIARHLQSTKYRFVTVTPETHANLLTRYEDKVSKSNRNPAADDRKVFGLNVRFSRQDIDEKLFQMLRQGNVIRDDADGHAQNALANEPANPQNGHAEQKSGHADDLFSRNRPYISKVRFSTIDDGLYAHSGYNSPDKDLVFFGPDTYRYVILIRDFVDYITLDDKSYHVKTAVDIGAGSGAGGLELMKYCHHKKVKMDDLILVDMENRALEMSAFNASLLGYSHTSKHTMTSSTFSTKLALTKSDILAAVPSSTPLDLIISNPPYIISTNKTYSDGGDAQGLGLSLRILKESIDRLQKGGYLVFYTGVAILEGGRDPLRETVDKVVAEGHAELVWYKETDVDVWGHEILRGDYAEVERINIVGTVLRKK